MEFEYFVQNEPLEEYLLENSCFQALFLKENEDGIGLFLVKTIATVASTGNL